MFGRIKAEFAELESISPKGRSFTEAERKLYFRSAISPFSLPKNRYPDVLPLENTRVHLSTTNFQDGSDFINANYVLEGLYISCQAPMLSTFHDFWRMIWEQGSSIIVMLTKLFEGGRTKAHMYWPNHFFKFGDLVVTKLEEQEFKYFGLRRFLLSKGDDAREVFQFHYTAWPDYGVPESTKGIRLLVDYVNMTRHEPDGPIVVHCSAGVGRTGSFIAVYHTLTRLARGEPEPSILQLTLKMRSERIGMVQTEKQYEFIYQAVQDFKMSEETDEDSASASDTSSSLDKSPRNWRNMSCDQVTMHNSFRISTDSDEDEVVEERKDESSSSLDSFAHFPRAEQSTPRILNWRSASSGQVRTLALSTA